MLLLARFGRVPACLLASFGLAPEGTPCRSVERDDAGRGSRFWGAGADAGAAARARPRLERAVRRGGAAGASGRGSCAATESPAPSRPHRVARAAGSRGLQELRCRALGVARRVAARRRGRARCRAVPSRARPGADGRRARAPGRRRRVLRRPAPCGGHRDRFRRAIPTYVLRAGPREPGQGWPSPTRAARGLQRRGTSVAASFTRGVTRLVAHGWEPASVEGPPDSRSLVPSGARGASGVGPPGGLPRRRARRSGGGAARAWWTERVRFEPGLSGEGRGGLGSCAGDDAQLQHGGQSWARAVRLSVQSGASKLVERSRDRGRRCNVQARAPSVVRCACPQVAGRGARGCSGIDRRCRGPSRRGPPTAGRGDSRSGAPGALSSAPRGSLPSAKGARREDRPCAAEICSVTPMSRRRCLLDQVRDPHGVSGPRTCEMAMARRRAPCSAAVGLW